MNSLNDYAIKKSPTKVKIFRSYGKGVEILEDRLNKWLYNNCHIHISNILTTSNAASFGEPDFFYAEELYLIVVYQEIEELKESSLEDKDLEQSDQNNDGAETTHDHVDWEPPGLKYEDIIHPRHNKSEPNQAD